MTDERIIIIAGFYLVARTKRDATVTKCKDLVERARAAPGCLDLSISADPVDPARINMFELWRSEKDLRAWRAIAKAPKGLPRMRVVKVRKHVVQKSGPPF